MKGIVPLYGKNTHYVERIRQTESAICNGRIFTAAYTGVSQSILIVAISFFKMIKKPFVMIGLIFRPIFVHDGKKILDALKKQGFAWLINLERVIVFCVVAVASIFAPGKVWKAIAETVCKAQEGKSSYTPIEFPLKWLTNNEIKALCESNTPEDQKRIRESDFNRLLTLVLANKFTEFQGFYVRERARAEGRDVSTETLFMQYVEETCNIIRPDISMGSWLFAWDKVGLDELDVLLKIKHACFSSEESLSEKMILSSLRLIPKVYELYQYEQFGKRYPSEIANFKQSFPKPSSNSIHSQFKSLGDILDNGTRTEIINLSPLFTSYKQSAPSILEFISESFIDWVFTCFAKQDGVDLSTAEKKLSYIKSSKEREHLEFIERKISLDIVMERYQAEPQSNTRWYNLYAKESKKEGEHRLSDELLAIIEEERDQETVNLLVPQLCQENWNKFVLEKQALRSIMLLKNPLSEEDDKLILRLEHEIEIASRRVSSKA